MQMRAEAGIRRYVMLTQVQHIVEDLDVREQDLRADKVLEDFEP